MERTQLRAKDSFEGKDSVEGKESVEDKGLHSGQRNQLRANDSVEGKLHRHLLPLDCTHPAISCVRKEGR